jgi:pectin lyase
MRVVQTVCTVVSALAIAGNVQAATVSLGATAGDGKVVLSWSASGNLRNAQVMRDTDANPAGRTRIAILAGNARGFTDNTVVNGRRYWYWIKYTDSSGAVGNSNAGSATPAAANSGGGSGGNNGNATDAPHDAAFGFGRTVTGGAGGATVRVTTPEQLRNALCGSTSGAYCSDNTPRIVEVASTIDFTDTEGSAQGQGCFATRICSAPARTEATLKYSASDTHCDGKALFNVTYKKAATRGLLVGSNKTLIGVGAAGAIKGKGLLLMGGVSNIIIRNLSFTDIAQGLVFGGDGITVSDAKRVWIDHNYFARIGRQMIVTGTGDQTGVVTDMTVSWNEFDGRNDYSPYCNGKHYWNHLFYGKGNFTFANNWLHDFSGRAPKIDSTAIVQVVNNLFENGDGHALDTGNSVHALVEGNDFENVTTPITSGSAHVYAVSASSSSDGACRGVLGRSCEPNQLGQSFAKQDASVLSAIDAVPNEAIVTPAAASTVRSTVRGGAGVGKI